MQHRVIVSCFFIYHNRYETLSRRCLNIYPTSATSAQQRLNLLYLLGIGSLLQPDTDVTRVSKCRQFSLQRRGLDPMLFQCWSSTVGGEPILKQHQVKTSCLLGSKQVFVYTQPSPSIIFSPADHGTFSKTAGQSQAYYNT